MLNEQLNDISVAHDHFIATIGCMFRHPSNILYTNVVKHATILNVPGVCSNINFSSELQMRFKRWNEKRKRIIPFWSSVGFCLTVGATLRLNRFPEAYIQFIRNDVLWHATETPVTSATILQSTSIHYLILSFITISNPQSSLQLIDIIVCPFHISVIKIVETSELCHEKLNEKKK